MKKLLPTANIFSLLIAIFVNYFINSKNDSTTSIGEISAQYSNLLTPADYAFSIWGLIYLALFVFAVCQLWAAFIKKTPHDNVREIGWWFVLANLSNAAWVIAFTNNRIDLSVLIMVILFFSLLKIILNTNMEKWDAPFPIIGFIWWPFSLYFGWITIALISNIAVWLTSTRWNATPLVSETWAILTLILAGIVFVTMIWKRNMREYAFVGVWGITAIAVKNWNSNPQVTYISITVATIIFVNAAVHGYKNRATAPFSKRDKPFGQIKQNGWHD